MLPFIYLILYYIFYGKQKNKKSKTRFLTLSPNLIMNKWVDGKT